MILSALIIMVALFAATADWFNGSGKRISGAHVYGRPTPDNQPTYWAGDRQYVRESTVRNTHRRFW